MPCSIGNQRCGRACIKSTRNCSKPPDWSLPTCTEGKSKRCGKACIPIGRDCKPKSAARQARAPRCGAPGTATPATATPYRQTQMDEAVRLRMLANAARQGTVAQRNLEKRASEAFLRAFQSSGSTGACVVDPVPDNACSYGVI